MNESTFIYLRNNTITCSCGHAFTFGVNSKDHVICKCCGKVIFRNSKAEFKYKLNQQMKKLTNAV